MYGLRIGFSGLLSQRQGLDTTGHNIANVNTEGYTRQRTVIQSQGAPTVPALWSKWTGPGAGSRAIDVERLRSGFLEARGQAETGRYNQLKATAGGLNRVELAFAEPGENGIQNAMNEFFSAYDDVANRPTEPAARIALQQRAEAVAQSFRSTKGQMEGLRVGVGEQINARIGEVNAYATQIATLNDAIQKATISNLSPNDLQDQRDVLVYKLSALIDVKTVYEADGSASVYVGSSSIVKGPQAQQLSYSIVGDQYDIEWGTTNVDVEISGGELGGLREMFDVQLRATVPPGPYDTRSWQDQLRVAAEDFVTQVNTLATSGFDLNGVAGVNLFQFNGTNDMIVNPAVAADPDLIVAADNNTNLANNEVARAIANLSSSSTGPAISYRAIISKLGIDAQTANQRASVQENIKNQIDSARQGEAGINIDEEMTNMLSYQRAYDASAKFINAVDEALQTLMSLVR